MRLLKDIAQDYERCARTVVLISYATEIPHELEHLSAQVALALPDRDERRRLVEEVARQWMRANPRQAVKVDPRALELLVENMSGLSATDTQRLARKAIFDHGAIEASDVPRVMRAKYEMLNHGGVLRYEPDSARLADVGGLANLKAWLQKRCAGLRRFGARARRPQGRAAAGRAGLRQEPGGARLRRHFQRAAAAARLRARCTTSTSASRSATCASRWRPPTCMAPVRAVDRRDREGLRRGRCPTAARRGACSARSSPGWRRRASRVFVVATANDIAALPPELIRKGRFDEIFFVDLPDLDTRAEILRIHAAKRGIALDPATLPAWRRACDGFSGAEIEQAIVAALYSAHAKRTNADAALLAAEIAATRPLAVVMAESVAELREWAKDRTVPAD